MRAVAASGGRAAHGADASLEERVVAIGRAATLSLHDELALSPKPGLVTLVDRGSHSDMDARTFMRSLFALRGYFVEVARLGSQGARFEDLQGAGLRAEVRMLEATGGVNTHRGAIFTLGLLCAAAGALAARRHPPEAATLREILLAEWGGALLERARHPSVLPGGVAARRHGLRGAAAEAACGFPVLFDVAIPALQEAVARCGPGPAAHVDTLFRIIAALDDCNIAHRGGLEGLRFAQSCAREFVASGGTSRRGGMLDAERIAEAFVRHRLSPGGAADLLAATFLLRRLGLVNEPASPP